MSKGKSIFGFILLLLMWSTDCSLVANAATFSDKIFEIRKEINRDNLEDAIKLLRKVKISSENEQEQIDLLFGDIYLKINKTSKAEEFYEKSFMTSDARIESLTFIGLAEVKLRQGQLDKAIDFAERSLVVNSDNTRAKILLALAKTRIGEIQEALDILSDLYDSQSDNAEVNLAIAGYYSSFDDSEKAIKILERYLRSKPTSIKVMDELGNLYWFTGNKDKALELKVKVLKHYKYSKNKYQVKKIKNWILSIEPTYFDKKSKPKGIRPKQSEEYEEKEIDNYEENKVVPHYEEYEFAANGGGSGFIIGKGKYVITNHHVIKGAQKIAVRNGIGKASNAKVYDVSENYDLAILEVEKPFSQEFAIDDKDFIDPRAGEDVLIIGYPTIGETFDLPTITQGIISKVFNQKGYKYEGTFLTTAAVNAGNSGGPVFNLNGKLVGVIYARIDQLKSIKEKGEFPTAMGYGITSNKIKEIFEYQKSIPIQKAKYSKAAIYQKMLPRTVNVAVLKDYDE